MMKEVQLINIELQKAKKDHPKWPENMFEQVTIVNEELGEVNKAILHLKHEGGSLQDVKDELVQTAAMCIRMLENL